MRHSSRIFQKCSIAWQRNEEKGRMGEGNMCRKRREGREGSDKERDKRDRQREGGEKNAVILSQWKILYNVRTKAFPFLPSFALLVYFHREDYAFYAIAKHAELWATFHNLCNDCMSFWSCIRVPTASFIPLERAWEAGTCHPSQHHIFMTPILGTPQVSLYKIFHTSLSKYLTQGFPLLIPGVTGNPQIFP